MKKKSKSIGGVRLENAMMAAGFCTGLSYREKIVLDEQDRRILKSAGKALAAACKELWPEWFK